jgi:hypothetical protein
LVVLACERERAHRAVLAEAATAANLDVVFLVMSMKWTFLNPSYVFHNVVRRLQSRGMMPALTSARPEAFSCCLA